MARLAVMAHYDPRGGVGPHVKRQVEALAAGFDDVLVVTTAQLTDESRAWLGSRARLVERTNAGYDFLSYKVGLDTAGDLTRYDDVAICNDTYVGPLRGYARMLDDMADRPADFWGFTDTTRIGRHVQSFFVVFRPWTVASQAFTRFWREMEPISDRRQVILRYEVGLSRTMYRAGLASAPYFVESDADRRLARLRVQWWALHRGRSPRTPADLKLVRAHAAEHWNPAAGLADRALEGGRLPYVKIDTLRYDPYGLGSDDLLTYCEETFPDEFDGVRRWLADTAQFYKPRADELLRPTPRALRPLAAKVRYRRAS